MPAYYCSGIAISLHGFQENVIATLPTSRAKARELNALGYPYYRGIASDSILASRAGTGLKSRLLLKYDDVPPVLANRSISTILALAFSTSLRAAFRAEISRGR
jgi:hypothetical protein